MEGGAVAEQAILAAHDTSAWSAENHGSRMTPMRITMIGHSTVLIEISGRRVLTDPYFGTRGNPAYRRVGPPASRREDLTDPDLVLVSHNHWDHVDRRFFRALSDSVPILAPRQSKWVTRLKGARHAVGMAAWASRDFGGLRITAVPALHSAVTIGFVLQGEGRRVYFAGDTYYRPFMAEIGREFDLDVALMPVTTYRIPMTMGERGAVHAARDLKPRCIIPVHLGLQPRQPLLRTSHSPEGFARRLGDAGLESDVVILEPGDRWSPATGKEIASRDE